MNLVLVLDDDPVFGELVVDLAEREGIEARAVATPEAFRAAYVQDRPTMIVLDVVLGDADACEVLDFLVEKRCEVPVFLVSGHDERLRQFIASLGRGLLIAETLHKRDGLKRLARQMNAYKVP